MADKVYRVERHDDSYHGPHTTRLAKSLETALDFAEEMRDDHHGETWELSTGTDDDEERMTFLPKTTGGWVRLKAERLHE